jgi:hypothetical protein
MVQTKENFWTDENGVQIPANRITKAEKVREKKTAMLVKKAQDLNARLKAFKEELKDACDEMEEVSLGELGVNTENFKGNLTFFNFDRSIKIERSISEPMKFDDLTIAAAKEKLDLFLREAIESKFDFAKEMIMTAFETRNGKLDPKKITPLTRYEAKVNHPLFTDACRLIQQAIRRPDSKTYYRIWVIKEEGEKHEAVELNLSNIQ